MARITIVKTNQLDRIDSMVGKMREVQMKSHALLQMKPDSKSWSAIEVIAHMTAAHAPYRAKLDHAILKLSVKSKFNWTKITMRRVASYVCKRMLPHDGEIKYKMKTTRKFQPSLPERFKEAKEIDHVFDAFYHSLNHLRSIIEQYGNLPVERIRFNSAIGPIVRFNVAEAVEFIISHNERHVVQLENTLKKCA